MLYAADEKGQHVLATPRGVGSCPLCGAPLIAHCGRIYIHHWSHKGSAECDRWAEHDTDWHLEWKRLVRPEACEVRMGTHRADIVGNAGVVIELQQAPLSVDAILEREAFYQRMVWLIDGSDFHCRLNLRNKGDYHSFRWKHPRRAYHYARAPMFWDFGDTLLEVGRVYDDLPCGGWGYVRSREWFIRSYLSTVLATEPIT